MMRAASFLPAAALLVAGVGQPAAADIYSYADSSGAIHYSNVPADPRFALLLRDPSSGSQAKRSERWGRWELLYRDPIDEAARLAGVPDALLRAVIGVESAFDPKAVSSKGAQGLMQLLPATSARYGVHDPFEPADNVRGGARYLRDLLKRYGNDLELALAAYNAGEDAVERSGRAIPPFPETRAYVPAVLELYRAFAKHSHLARYTKTLPPAT
jgi:soluble lytic murein transglycosylase-like protein